MWRRAGKLLATAVGNMESLQVMDPCAGGGKLLIPMGKSCSGVGYEPDYSKIAYARAYFEQNHLQAEFINEPFEAHFTRPYFPQFHLVISIPYTDKKINSTYEKDPDCLAMKNYAFYVMNRSMDILMKDGYGIFAIPKDLVSAETFADEIDCISKKAEILEIEGLDSYAIISLRKK